jgi:hypothetical protein
MEPMIYRHGFVCDGPWNIPGVGSYLQFTKRIGGGPALAATFYVPIGASDEQINNRADEVFSEFERGIAA